MVSGYVALFTRAWIEIASPLANLGKSLVALFTRAWIEMFVRWSICACSSSPSLRGRGLKSYSLTENQTLPESPSLRGRGLKYRCYSNNNRPIKVALFTRAWIEIVSIFDIIIGQLVALFTRAWIEISIVCNHKTHIFGRPLYEGVD